MRPLLRTRLAGDDRGPRALAAFSMLIGVYVVVRAIGLDPVPALVSRLVGEAEGSTVVAALPSQPRATAPRAAQATTIKPARAGRAATAPTTRAKPAQPQRRTRVGRGPAAQPAPGAVEPAPAPNVTPKRPQPPQTGEAQQPAPAPAPPPVPEIVAEPAPIVPPPPPAHLPDPPTVPLPDPTAAVDPGTLTPPVALPVEPPLPNLPSVP
jgi:hypothetical protein